MHYLSTQTHYHKMNPFNSRESFNPDIIDFGPTLSNSDYEGHEYKSSSPTEPELRDAEPPSESQRRVQRSTQRRQSQSDNNATSKKTGTRKEQKLTGVSPRRRTTSLINILNDSRTRIFVGIILGLCTVYLTIVTLSYFTNVVHDQSTVINNNLTVMADKSGQIENIGGPLGAWLGDLLISRWMGVGTFVMIIYLALVSLSLLKVHRTSFWPLTFRCLLSMIAISIVVGLITLNLESVIFWGGEHGHYLNIALINMAGIPGAVVISLIMLSLVVLLFFNDLRRWYGVASERITERRQRIAQRRAAEKAEHQHIKAEEKDRAKAEAAEKKTDIHDTNTTATVNEDTLENSSEPHHEDPIEFNTPIATIDVPVDTSVEMEIEVPQIEQANLDDIDQEAETGCTSGDTELYDPRADLSHYRFPSLDLLHEIVAKDNNVDTEEQEENKQRITKTLLDYGIPISSIKATVGPTVTLYEIIPAEGVRIAKIKRLEDDIALSLAALGIRIIAPIPGKGTIGIEVPNKDPQVVAIRSILGSKSFQECRMELPMALGSTISNDVFIADLTKMPHLLVAGATGMGKSVGLNTIVASLLYKKHPAELKFVFVDPKMVEFSLYAKLERHYLAKLPDEENPIITDPSKVVATLNSLCLEMDNRYQLLMDASCRNLKEYNAKFMSRRLNPEKGHRFLPYIVVVVDEFGDLIITAGKEVETPISRIAAKARAVGIHMILATQRPSTNVITGVIKANFPGRMAFRVFQMVDSRTILDRPGANQLIGRGDMLFSNNGKIDRVQCAFIDTDEVESICDAIDNQMGYLSAYELPEFIPDDTDGAGLGSLSDRDTLFDEAARFVVQSSTASTSSLQRRYSIGYNRAGKIMDQLEAAGVVGPSMGGKPRQVLMDPMQLERLLEMN